MMAIRTWAAYGVHLFTATGVVFGFLALMATVEDRMFMAFVYLGVALLIDGIDGTFARWVRVKEVTPHVDGASLDNVIDFFTYAIIPAAMVWFWDLVPEGWGTAAGAAILLASCATYANANMKTADGYFVGFPAIWNVVVLYLVIFGAGPTATLVTIAICFILSFVPTAYVHPFRVRTLMPLTIVATILWSLSASVLTWTVLAKSMTAAEQPLWQALLILSSLYFAGISLWRSFKTS